MRRACAAVAVLALAGCGDGGDPRREDVPPAGQETRDRIALRQVVTGVYEGYGERDGRTICRLLATPVRSALTGFVNASGCRAAVERLYRDVPPRQAPRAIFEADGGAFEIARHGDTATIRFGDGGSWDLARSGERWLITRAPLLPKSAVAPGRTPPPLRATRR